MTPRPLRFTPPAEYKEVWWYMRDNFRYFRKRPVARKTFIEAYAANRKAINAINRGIR